MQLIEQKIMGLWVAVLLSSSLVMAVSVDSVFAQNTSSEYQRSIDEIDQEIRKITANINANKRQRQSARDALLVAEKSLHATSAKLSSVQAELKTLIKEQAALATDLDTKSVAAEKARSELARLLKQQYIDGGTSYLKTLLNQQNPYALGRFQHYQNYFKTAYTERYQLVVAQIQTILEQQALLSDKTIKIQQAEADLVRLRESQQAQQKRRSDVITRLDKKIGGAEDALRTLQENRERLKTLLGRLKDQAKRLKELARQREQERRRQPAQVPSKPEKPMPKTLLEGGFAKQKGRLRCPLATEPSPAFGVRLPESGMRSEGLFYTTDGEQPVSSVFKGRVLFADFLKGYGLLIIVDHGDDHLSLYGHNSRVTKKVGDFVTANEIIARTGVTGGLKSHGLYFEIRHNTRPVNPQLWCQ